MKPLLRDAWVFQTALSIALNAFIDPPDR